MFIIIKKETYMVASVSFGSVLQQRLYGIQKVTAAGDVQRGAPILTQPHQPSQICGLTHRNLFFRRTAGVRGRQPGLARVDKLRNAIIIIIIINIIIFIVIVLINILCHSDHNHKAWVVYSRK
jgi:hypothetical protein